MITHTISKREFDSMPDNEPLRQRRIIEAMVKLGMPIVGVIAIERPERGTLTISYDEMFEETTYSWSE